MLLAAHPVSERAGIPSLSTGSRSARPHASAPYATESHLHLRPYDSLAGASRLLPPHPALCPRPGRAADGAVAPPGAAAAVHGHVRGRYPPRPARSPASDLCGAGDPRGCHLSRAALPVAAYWLFDVCLPAVWGGGGLWDEKAALMAAATAAHIASRSLSCRASSTPSRDFVTMLSTGPRTVWAGRGLSRAGLVSFPPESGGWYRLGRQY